MSQTSTNVTQLLQEWSDGSGEALDRLIPIIYEELRGRAAGYLRRERPRPHAATHRARQRSLPAAG